MEMLYLLIAFVIGGVVGGAIMGLWRRANSQGGDEALRIELAKLQSEKEAQALKSSSVRGQWGEVQLRRVVELAGMERRVAFDEQVSGDRGRPDMVVYLLGGGVLPVDAKTPMTAYLNAAEAGEDATYKNYMRAHAQAVRGRVRELGQKAYWSQFEKVPEFVVMFVPVEASVAAAFESFIFHGGNTIWQPA